MLSRVAVASARRAASCISRRTALASSTVARAAPAVAGTRFASTIPELLDESVDRIPLKDAFRCVHQKTRWTYDELVKYTDAYACGLHEGKSRVSASRMICCAIEELFRRAGHVVLALVDLPACCCRLGSGSDFVRTSSRVARSPFPRLFRSFSELNSPAPIPQLGSAEGIRWRSGWETTRRMCA